MDPQVRSLGTRAAMASLRPRFPFRTYSANYSVVVVSLVVVLAAREVRGHAKARTSSTVCMCLWRISIKARRPS
jgi:hypothetical protein